jgi:hypothetical protein
LPIVFAVAEDGLINSFAHAFIYGALLVRQIWLIKEVKSNTYDDF